MPEEKCPICSREALGSKFCNHHELAEKNLLATFERWKHAYSKLDWAEYLTQVQGLEMTGQWVKEVTKYLLENP